MSIGRLSGNLLINYYTMLDRRIIDGSIGVFVAVLNNYHFVYCLKSCRLFPDVVTHQNSSENDPFHNALPLMDMVFLETTQM